MNGEQADIRDKFVVIVAYSRCLKGPHKGTSTLPFVVGGQQTYGNRTGP